MVRRNSNQMSQTQLGAALNEPTFHGLPLLFSLCLFHGNLCSEEEGKGFLMMRFGSKMNRYKISKN